jgi:uncharacterized membrane protein YeiH
MPRADIGRSRRRNRFRSLSGLAFTLGRVPAATAARLCSDGCAASTNALNGALLARRPDHFKSFTIVGIVGMALLGGLGGGMTRDVLLGDVPSALTNPAYITAALAFGLIGYNLAYAKGQLFREGLSSS